MYATERQQIIESILQDAGRVSVVELSDRFDVTTETVRRDLDALEKVGSLRRVHGGAVRLDRQSTAEPSLTERIGSNAAAKSAIAELALAALGDRFHGSIYLDAGTTVAALAERLPEHLGIHGGRAEIVTHALPFAAALAVAENVSLSLIGGRVRGLTAAAVGAGTVRAIEALRPDVAFLGSNALSARFGLSTPDPDEAAVKEAIVRAARLVIAVIDATKFGRDSLVHVAALADIDVLVTDEAPEGELATALRDAEVEVRIA